ncbi:hypothetical protein [Acetobacter pasteurianus]|uniref:Uncharacterized protein n=1 Tax=Acetobacter pasteurianus NBRC 3188 TaxID=1226663 RepID=A0A401WWU1_ACEPA|nr:hypothetical protein [Acetobacter pasteurianus]GCD53744.1 hypothetical protein NBRC3188_2441 [Acetobacter pasteurianus NBRC 3188]
MKDKAGFYIIVIVSVVTIPLFISIFPSVHWKCLDVSAGDLATWVSAGVSLLALLMAGYAAYLGKKAADIQNRNSTTLSLNTLIESRAEKANIIYGELSSSLEKYYEIKKLNNAGSLDKGILFITFSETQSNIMKCARMLKVIISLTCDYVEKSHIPQNDKKDCIELFFSILDPYMPSEIILRQDTIVFFEDKPEYSKIDKIYYGYLSEMIPYFEQSGLFTEFIKSAEDRGFMKSV